MKNILLFAIACFCIQNVAFGSQWFKSLGGQSNENGQTIYTDANGNVYTTGYFEGIVDFDPGTEIYNLTSQGNYDIFVTKMDASGNLLWAVSFGSVGIDQGYGVLTDASGNVYLTGWFNDTVDFDPGIDTFNLISEGSDDIFIIKINPSGNLIWAKSIGGTSDDSGFSLGVDSSGNVFTAGYFKSIVDFDPGAGITNLTSQGDADMFILKLDKNGTFSWVKQITGLSYVRPYALKLDASGNIFTSGVFNGIVDFDPGSGISNLQSSGIGDIFCLKQNASGDFVWAKRMGGVYNDYSRNINLDAAGNVYLTGTFTNFCDFNPDSGPFNVTSNGGTDIFAAKFDASGNFKWAKNIGSTYNDYGHGSTTDAAGNVYITGNFQGTCDFNPHLSMSYPLTSSGSFDMFVTKLDSTGSFVWARQMGGYEFEAGISIALDAQGLLYITGQYTGTTDLNPGAGVDEFTAIGEGDIFVLKIDEDAFLGVNPSFTLNNITLYPNPANEILFINTNSLPLGIKYQIIDALGKVVLSGSIQENTTFIEVSHLQTNLYYFQLDGINNHAFKFVKL